MLDRSVKMRNPARAHPTGDERVIAVTTCMSGMATGSCISAAKPLVEVVIMTVNVAHVATTSGRWPALPLEEWLPTQQTLHRWTQIVGKTRLRLAPFMNHWWHCSLYLTPRGLTTSAMPYDAGDVEIDFDFLDEQLVARTSTGDTRRIRLENKSVADFYKEFRAMLVSLGVDVRITGKPNELSDATPFARDVEHATYDADAARRCWRVLLEADRLLKQFRSRFAGKCSPSHFWWGGFDIACTRFSGRTAPAYSGSVPNVPAYVMREAYSHECISGGWWPGVAGSPVPYPAFYAYAYPEPAGCSTAPIEPKAAFYHQEMREWILPYDAVRSSPSPDEMVLAFLDSTYETAARLGRWDVGALRSSASDFEKGATGKIGRDR